jgi:CheY-like chemotaxis protein
MMLTRMSQGRPYRVLIVDDEEPIRLVVDRILRQASYETVLAASGPDALAILEANQSFDLLLTDLRMPEMNGDELARRAWLRKPDLKVLYLTGYSDYLFGVRRKLWAHEAFLDKPPTAKDVLEAVALSIFGTPHGPH